MPGSPGESIASALDLVAENDGIILELETQLQHTQHQTLVASCTVLGWLVTLRNTVKAVHPQLPRRLRDMEGELTRQQLDAVGVGRLLLYSLNLRA